MNQGEAFKIHELPRLQNPSLIVAWSQDAGRLGSKVIDLLNRKLGGREMGELDASAFFSLWGVQIEDNVIQFPESKFYSCETRDLILFKSDSPAQEWYKFLNTILDVAVLSCKAKQVFSIGGFISSMAHTSVRRTIGVVSRPELKEFLLEDVPDIDSLEYQTPLGGRPTMNSYLMWVAKRRDVSCINLWSEVPFYLAAAEDPRACKKMLAILDRKFKLGITLDDIEDEIKSQNEKIEELKARNPDIARYVEMLEKGIMLNQEESEKLAKDVLDFLS